MTDDVLDLGMLIPADQVRENLGYPGTDGTGNGYTLSGISSEFQISSVIVMHIDCTKDSLGCSGCLELLLKGIPDYPAAMLSSACIQIQGLEYLHIQWVGII